MDHGFCCATLGADVVMTLFHVSDVTHSLIRPAWCAGAESTAAGFPLSGVADLAQGLHKLIKNLFKMVHDEHHEAILALLASSTDTWQAVQLQLQQESRRGSKMRLLRDGFVHAVLLALENRFWSTDIEAIFCFCLKQQVLLLHFLATREQEYAVQQ